jgi:peptidoglycan/LPS O-acetylase OafA/YrhL
VLFSISMAGLYWPFPGAQDLYQLFAQPLLAVATAALVLSLWRGQPARLHRFLELRPLAYLGKISYALYLFHPMVIAWIPERFGDRNSTARLLLSLLATIGLAALSWRFFEKPINGLKERFPYPASGTGLVDEPLRDGGGDDVRKLAAS